MPFSWIVSQVYQFIYECVVNKTALLFLAVVCLLYSNDHIEAGGEKNERVRLTVVTIQGKLSSRLCRVILSLVPAPGWHYLRHLWNRNPTRPERQVAGIMTPFRLEI